MRPFVPLHEDALVLLKVKNFSIKAKSIAFEDEKFLNAKEKQAVYKKWISFLNNHFKVTGFNKRLYDHLYLHCGYIAHYNIHGFYGTYFSSSTIYHMVAHGFKTPMHECGGNGSTGHTFLGKDSIEAKKAFYTIYEELFNGSNRYDEGLASFLANWTNENYIGVRYSGSFSDLNRAMRDSFEEYFVIWEELIAKANADHDKASEKKHVEELKVQRERLEKAVTDAKTQLNEINEEITEEILHSTQKSIPKQMSLFDFVISDVA